MEINVTFDIVVQATYGTFKMQVNHIYSSDQVERFVVTGGDKQLKMEKRRNVPARHASGWKITQGDIRTKHSKKDASLALIGITRAIDDYLDGRDTGFKNGYIDKVFKQNAARYEADAIEMDRRARQARFIAGNTPRRRR